MAKNRGTKKAAKSVKSQRPKAPTDDLRTIDRDLLRLINERATAAKEEPTAEQDVSAHAIDSARIADLVAANPGPLPDAAVRSVFREIESGCIATRRPTRVAFLGPEFTYSHLAVIERFGQSIEFLPLASIAAVFDAVARKQANYGIVPMENSTDGRVTDTLGIFARSPLPICGEVPLRIHHCLLGIGRQNEVREVYSKPQALSQCRNWLAQHLPKARLMEVASTAEAAQMAAENQHAAAVASRQAATNHGLDILCENIEDDPQNLTRFAVIGHEQPDRTGNDKTSLVFEVEHRPGALADAMAIFKRNQLNLTWIESFPVAGNPGRYLFFIEVLGHQKDLRLRRALKSLEGKSVRLDILGSYERAEAVG